MALKNVAKIIITADSRQARREFSQLDRDLKDMKARMKTGGALLGSLFGKGKGDLTHLQNVRKNFDGFKKSMGGWTGMLSKVTSGLATVGYGIGAVGVVIGTVFAKAVSSAASFEDKMSMLSRLANTSEKDVDSLSDAVLDMSMNLGVGANELADALYFIKSAGIKSSAEAMDILAISAKGAVAGLGDVATVAKTITAMINAYGKGALSAAEAGDIFIRAAQEGSAEAKEYAAELQQVVPTAAMLGVELGDVAGAMAVMTNRGLSASTAAVSLNQAFVNILKPSKAALDSLKEVGLSADDLKASLDERGIMPTLVMLQKAFKGDSAEMVKLFGNARSMRAVFTLLHGDYAKTAETIDRVIGKNEKLDKTLRRSRRSIDGARRSTRGLASSQGELGEAFDKAERSTSQKYNKAMNGLKVIMIKLGEKAIPAVNRMLEKMNTEYLPAVSEWVDQNGPKITKFWKNVVTWVEKNAPAIGRLVGALAGLATWVGQNATAIHAALNFMFAPIIAAAKAWDALKSVTGTGAGGAQSKGGKGGAVPGTGKGGDGVSSRVQSSGAAITVNVNGPIVGTGPGSADALARLVERAIQQRSMRVARGYA